MSETKQKTGKGLIGSTVMFILSLIMICITIVGFLNISGKSPEEVSKSETTLLEVGLFMIVPEVILFFASFFVNMSYRSENEHRNVWSTIMLVLTIIPVGLILGIFLLGRKLYKESMKSPPTPAKKYKIKDGNGKEHELTKQGDKDYKDENGEWWISYDGKDFEKCKK